MLNYLGMSVIAPETTAAAAGTTGAATPLDAGRGLLEERCSNPGLLLAMLGHVAMRRLRDVHTAFGMTPRQFRVLALLREHGSMGQKELGQAAGAEPSILVTMLNPLEADGLIARRRDPQDRRRHVVSITSAGDQHLTRAAQAHRDAEDALFSGLDDDRRELLRQLLLELQESLGSLHPTPCDVGAADATLDADATL